MRRVLPSLLALSLFGGPAWAADPGAPAEQTLGSVHALIQRTMRDALDWSPDAKLYSVVGKGPKSGVLWEEWTVMYGDPKTRYGFYSVTFADGVLLARRAVKAGTELRERYWDGKLQSRSVNAVDWNGVYSDGVAGGVPLGGDFIDAPALDAVLKANRFMIPNDGQYHLELVRLDRKGNDYLTKFLLDGTFRQIGEIAHNTDGRAVWIADNLTEAVFLDARTKKLVNRRPSTQNFKGPEDWLVKP